LEDVEKDLREMKVKNWRGRAVDRAGWASVIRGSKFSEGRTAME